MTAVIVSLFLVGYVFIAAEHFTHVNKSAIAMLLGVVGWLLFMLDGLYSPDLFTKYVTMAGELSLFLLSTMSIVDVMHNNGCFDFLIPMLRRRHTATVLWGLVGLTFVLSANLDNLTSTVMMLYIMHKVVANQRQRMYVGSAIIIAANAGGALTVIGDVTTLMLWSSKGAITPTEYSAAMALPLIVATVVPTLLIQFKLPPALDIVMPRTSYHGDDNTLPAWQRIVLFLVGIGGLWFIPTFHRLTGLPPFVGALCVLAVFGVVNEIINLRRMQCDLPVVRQLPRSLQFETIQTITFLVGIILAVGVLAETGALAIAANWLDSYVHNVYLVSIAMGLLSGVLDNIALVAGTMSMYPVYDSAAEGLNYIQGFLMDGQYWHLAAYSAGVGGCLLPIGSAAGYALMKSDDVTFFWYVKRISFKVLLGWLLGLGTYFVVDRFLRPEPDHIIPKEELMVQPFTEVEEPVKADSVVLGTLGRGTGMSVVEFITLEGDTFRLCKTNEYTGEEATIVGDIVVESDTFAVRMSSNRESMSSLINLTQTHARQLEDNIQKVIGKK